MKSVGVKGTGTLPQASCAGPRSLAGATSRGLGLVPGGAFSL